MNILVIVVGLILVALTFLALNRSRPVSSEERTRAKSDNSEPTYTSRLIKIFQTETVELGGPWRQEPATESQLARLSEIVSEGSIVLPSNLTKGQASDAIGLFREPSEEEQLKLKFFKVPNVAKLNQTEARITLYEVFSDPESQLKWENRPASSLQKEKIRFLGGKVKKGLQFREASELIEVLARSDLVKLSLWDSLYSAYEDLIDPDTRELFDIKRFSWSQFHGVMGQLQAKGESLDDLIYDEEKVYEALVSKYPRLKK